MALDPALLEILACPEDKGPLYYLADEGLLVQPAAAPRVRGPRRHPGDADRRGAGPSTTPSTTRLQARIDTEAISPTF